MRTGMALMIALCLAAMVATAKPLNKVTVPWHAKNVRDLHNEYGNIFKYGNRNAASHLWSTFLLERAHQMSDKKLRYMFSGFCVVSGSPLKPNDYNRFRLNLPLVTGGWHLGYLHYCCWPCVCDTQDFIRIDTKTIETVRACAWPRYCTRCFGSPRRLTAAADAGGGGTWCSY